MALTIVGCTASVISFSSRGDVGTGVGGSVASAGSTGGAGGGTGGTTSVNAGSDAGGGLLMDANAIDAMPDVDYGGICRSNAPDSGNTCRDQCLCSECPVETIRCLSNLVCRNFAECGFRSGCVDTVCTVVQCMSELSDAGMADITMAVALASCHVTRCRALCSGDATGDGATSDARE